LRKKRKERKGRKGRKGREEREERKEREEREEREEVSSPRRACGEGTKKKTCGLGSSGFYRGDRFKSRIS
jgi:hypothetical protein